jgi:hypothetical protein
VLPLAAVTESGSRSWFTPRAAVIASAILLLGPLLYPLVTGRVFTRDDLAALHLPFRFLYAEALRAGEFLLWTPAYHAGFFLHGAGEAGMAHPLHLALYSWLPLGVAFNLEIISSYLFLSGGVYLLLRALGLSLEAAIVGAMWSAFSGFTLYNLMHVNHIATLAHAPWLLLACHWLLAGPVRPAAAFALAALVTGSQLLTGNPQYMWITLVAVVYLCAIHLWRSPRIAPVAGLAAAALLGVSIGAIQLLPSIEFFNDSARSVWTAEQALSFSLSPWNLVQLWAPFAFEFRVFAPGEEFIVHEFIVYNGAFCTLSLAWIAIRWRDLRQRQLALVFLGFAALALWLAFGRYGGLYPWLARLPVLSGFRAPARHVVLFQFALAGLAAIAFMDLVTLAARRERIDARRLWPLAVPVVLAVATIAIAAGLSGSDWAATHQFRFSPFQRSAPWSVALVLSAALLTLAARGRSWAVAPLIVVAALDLAVWGYSYPYRYGPIRSIAELTTAAQVPAEAQPGDVIPPVTGGRDYLAILRGMRLTNGYTGLYPQTSQDFGNPTIERLAGIRWRGDGDRWQAVPDALPRARLVSSARVSASPGGDLATIDVTQVALVERDLHLSGEPGSARLLSERPGRFDVETASSGRQLLIVTERFHPAWRVTVDGAQAETVRVYGDFLGAVVEPGTHQVSVRFAPRSVTLGRQLTILGLVLTALGALAIDRRGWLSPSAT